MLVKAEKNTIIKSVMRKIAREIIVYGATAAGVLGGIFGSEALPHADLAKERAGIEACARQLGSTAITVDDIPEQCDTSYFTYRVTGDRIVDPNERSERVVGPQVYHLPARDKFLKEAKQNLEDLKDEADSNKRTDKIVFGIIGGIFGATTGLGLEVIGQLAKRSKSNGDD